MSEVQRGTNDQFKGSTERGDVIMSGQMRARSERACGTNISKATRGGMRALSVAAAGAVVGVAAGTASAADWDGAPGTPLPFEDPVNWNPDGIPSGADANINNGGIATLSTFSGGVEALNIGTAVGGNGTLVQSGGSLSTGVTAVFAANNGSGAY